MPPEDDRIDQSKRTINSIVARIYDSQVRLGKWSFSDELSSFGDFFADLHARISEAYEILGEPPDSEGEEESIAMPLVEVVMSCLAMMRHHGFNVGDVFIRGVFAQGTEAARYEKELDEGWTEQEGPKDEDKRDDS